MAGKVSFRIQLGVVVRVESKSFLSLGFTSAVMRLKRQCKPVCYVWGCPHAPTCYWKKSRYMMKWKWSTLRTCLVYKIFCLCLIYKVISMSVEYHSIRNGWEVYECECLLIIIIIIIIMWLSWSWASFWSLPVWYNQKSLQWSPVFLLPFDV